MEFTSPVEAESAVEIRPGVFRPDWSAVTTPGARQALLGRMAARAGSLSKWSRPLEAAEDLVWRTVLRLYAEGGQAPGIADIARSTGVAPAKIESVLRTLEGRDLLSLDRESRHIRLAYPFTESVTGHRIELRGRALNALCAIDALGVAAMYGTDVRISSACRHCGEPIRVATAAKGRALSAVDPSGAVVWYDFTYDGCAHSSTCPSIVFFCSDEHLQSWREAQKPRRDGVRLTIDGALEVGRAIFGPVLAEPSSGVSNARPVP
jgi:hypothetical protein